ncbi:TPA: AraC family transcriptional regulator [Klebsiella aerogenes]|uniref:AraC family transcriptional regulator n=1 Tax=Klebsiella TaxID=570 RepID=UPI00228E2B62|nr:AraC family transcriptional regulator [Klebsiella aerogenes]MDY0846848.1 AraC family transcriptional regulator [Klebsiella aerogenes]WPS33405.1 AraC family transcriptional regulator [Klebsiella aerogenes]HCT3748964.1 helix-turn-helix transcriptional regulator [Klebsiella aerogenes]HCT8624375.1 helix-turn-helix transcriptional regulator [Klebsiella aerogenes]HCT8633522.1 helix-turn-helix transcriptional regulator [Klebsiella aerogenes]
MLNLSMPLPIKVQNGGLFISRGIGSHPARKLQSWEIIFVEKGTLTIREDEETFCVRAGESLLLWPERLHVGVEQFPADLKFYWLHFEMIPEALVSSCQPKIALPQHTRVAEPQYIISLFRQFLREQENIHRSVALELILLLILQQLSAAAEELPVDTPGNALAWKAQQIILTQYHLPLSAATLAKELHCNADYLGRVYRHAFHLTLTDALHRQRVRAAEKLLISDSLSLSEVARQCGFNDVGYFRKIFRKHTSLTPAAWKRRYCKEHINSA